ncbi:hypothetical protein, partial [Erwinia amylovora]|uniref:hypothetical protein n=1 Tax=Erwinia amylovora TaxID=552 RepID=UPI0020C09A76
QPQTIGKSINFPGRVKYALIRPDSTWFWMKKNAGKYSQLRRIYRQLSHVTAPFMPDSPCLISGTKVNDDQAFHLITCCHSFLQFAPFSVI